MTIRDPEVLEALRDQPELLALADAVTETQKVVRPSRRRALSRAGALAAVGAAVLVAVLLWPSGGGRNPILDRALAAIGGGPVLHLVVQVPAGQELVNLRTGQSIVPKVMLESWSDRELRHFHFIYRENGRILAEFSFPEDRPSDAQVASIDPAYAALWSGYREALATGKATIVGKGSIYGHEVYWLRFNAGSEVAVDRKTYKLVAFRSISGSGRQFDSRVLLARTEPYRSDTFNRKTAAPSPLSGTGSGSTGVAPASPGSSPKPWLQAGPTVAGLKYAGGGQMQTTTDGKTTIGFHLAYGPETSMRKSLTIDEEKTPSDRGEWRFPKGFIRLTVGEGSENNSHPYPIWTGYVIRDGVFVTITTAVSRAAVLEAARALK